MKTVPLDHLITERRSSQIPELISKPLSEFTLILDPPLSSLSHSKSPRGVCETETHQADQPGGPSIRRATVTINRLRVETAVIFWEYASRGENGKQSVCACVLYYILYICTESFCTFCMLCVYVCVCTGQRFCDIGYDQSAGRKRELANPLG